MTRYNICQSLVYEDRWRCYKTGRTDPRIILYLQKDGTFAPPIRDTGESRIFNSRRHLIQVLRQSVGKLKMYKGRNFCDSKI